MHGEPGQLVEDPDGDRVVVPLGAMHAFLAFIGFDVGAPLAKEAKEARTPSVPS